MNARVCSICRADLSQRSHKPSCPLPARREPVWPAWRVHPGKAEFAAEVRLAQAVTR